MKVRPERLSTTSIAVSSAIAVSLLHAPLDRRKQV
jgi:hypothetical protein